MRLIGFNGGYGSGKSTAISSLSKAVKESGDTRTLRLVKFADTLYMMQETLYGMIADTYKRPPDFVKDRKLLQWLGTEWGRGLDENLWVKTWLRMTNAAFERNEIVVCDDVRFDNEGEVFKSLGGIIVKIERPDNAKHAIGGTGIANHASEAGLNPQYIDHVIRNDSTLEAFQYSLTSLYRKLGIGSDNRIEQGSINNT